MKMPLERLVAIKTYRFHAQVQCAGFFKQTCNRNMKHGKIRFMQGTRVDQVNASRAACFLRVLRPNLTGPEQERGRIIPGGSRGMHQA